MNWPRLILTLAAVAFVGWLLWLSAQKFYVTERKSLLDRIESRRGYLESADREADQRRKLDRQLQAVVDRTLAGTRESADHALRSRLNRMTELVGLSKRSVSTTGVSARTTPARDQLKKRSERALRDEVDLVELGASISGEGTLEQVLRLVHVLESEPWPKRIDQLRIEPRREAERFGVNLRLTTLFLPQTKPPAQPELTEMPAGFDKYVALVDHSLFRLPPPPPPQPNAEPQQESKPPPPPFPYGQWVLTGIVESPDGAEAWLVNQRSGKRRALQLGQKLNELVLVAVAADRATFQEGQKQTAIVVGQTLAQRKPARKQRELR